ncbi:MAG: hypothetical protein CM15mP84_06230 [Cellvibrionales bacterium]|nr:MAG: hypothetical protein CM15mP84_06230 [Cellvibrionales bacterium]
MMMHSVHALLDQEYSGDINIVPKFRFQNPLNLISQPTEAELRQLVKEGERATYSRIEPIRRCTQISRTLEEILHRFEYGDLRPAPELTVDPRARGDARPHRRPKRALKAETAARAGKAGRSLRLSVLRTRPPRRGKSDRLRDGAGF